MIGVLKKKNSVSSNFLERLWLLAKIDFKLRYYENNLGLFWALLKPIMDVAVYYIVFKTILKTDIPNFASYLFIGLILWNFFLESTSGTIQILQVKKYLYEYSNMNKLELYIATLLSNSIGLFFNLVMFLIFYNFFESDIEGFSWFNFWIIPIFFNLFILSIGVAFILSSIYIFAKDITQIWQVFTSILFFLSPIFYKFSLFKESLPAFEYANPIAGIIINARLVMMQGKMPDLELLVFDFGYALLLMFIGLIVLNKYGSKAAEKL
jgi:ABC-type polysaccharide/polyol phosphate export permease